RKKNCQPPVVNGCRQLSAKLVPSCPNRFMPLQHEGLNSKLLCLSLPLLATIYRPQLGS
ncbi:uncharacterized protein METZ01_LOCUS293336, partial [marine metagenome]